MSEGAKRFLQNILELAEKGNIDNAHAALKSKAPVFVHPEHVMC
jgi:hypothetical protein